MKGIDVSYWQGAIDWAKVRAAGYEFAAVRATVGDYYTDPNFITNVKGAKAAGLQVGAYFVMAPKDSTLSRTISAQAHLDKFKAALSWLPVELHLDFVVLDCELDRGATPEVVSTLIRDILAGLKNFERVLIYTAQYWWNLHVLRSPEWALHPLMVANYVDAPTGTPSLPADWAKATIWQWSKSGPVDGVTSGNCDKDLFLGTEAEYSAFFGLSTDLDDLVDWVDQLNDLVTAQQAEIAALKQAHTRDVTDMQAQLQRFAMELSNHQTWLAELDPKVSALQKETSRQTAEIVSLDQRMATGGKALAG